MWILAIFILLLAKLETLKFYVKVTITKCFNFRNTELVQVQDGNFVVDVLESF